MSHDNPEDTLVIGTWQGINNWFEWKTSRQRKSFESMLEIYQDGPTKYEEYIVGAPVHTLHHEAP